MKILVTGGTGRIGANLVKGLLAKGHEIRSFVYPGDRSRAHKLDGFERVETVEGDLRNLEDVKRAVEGGGCYLPSRRGLYRPFRPYGVSRHQCDGHD